MFKKISVFMLTLIIAVAIPMASLAATFTPSVVSKPAPEIVEQTNAAGEKVGAIIYDATGKEVGSVPTGEIIVTPISTASKADADTKAKFEAANTQLKAADDLASIVPELTDAVKAVDSTMTTKDLAVSDLFDVTLTGTAKDLLAQEGNTIKIVFNTNIKAGSPMFVIHNYEDTKWELIDNDKVTTTGTAKITATVEFSSLSPVAFLTDVSSIDTDPSAPSSPVTGSNNTIPVMLWIAAGVGLFAIAAIVVVAKKRTASN